MRLLTARDLRMAARLSAAFVAGAGLIALWTATTDPQITRAALHFGFAHVPRVPAQALSIYWNNLPLLCVPLAMAALVQFRRLIERPGRRRLYVGHCDLAAAAPTIKTAVVVGVPVGAYGGRMLSAMLPSGPVEIAAFALAGAVYVRARRASDQDDWRTLIGPALVAIVVLAIAAALEALT